MLLQKYKKILWLVLFGGLFLPVSSAFAVANLEVVFTPDPLFSEVDFLPGSTTTGTVAVTNNSTTTQDILTEATNITDASGLGAALTLNISDGAGTLYEALLSDFLRGGEVLLLPLSRASSKTYTYSIGFNTNAPDSVQNATLGFDLCIGFRGGARNCGDTAISSEHRTDTGDTGNAGGTVPGTNSGGGGGFVPDPQPAGSLALLSIQAYAPGDLPPGTVRIVWDTNYLSTSQVVYGVADGGPYSIDLLSPTFGYPSVTVQDPLKVTHHSVDISGLTPGAMYLYRVISTASPPTVSFEQKFTVPNLSADGGSNGGSNISSVSVPPSETIRESFVTSVPVSERFALADREASNRSARTQAGGGSGVASPQGRSGSFVAEDVPFVSPGQESLGHVPPVSEENGGTKNAAAAFLNTIMKGNLWLILVGVIALFSLLFLAQRKKSEY